MSNGNYWLVVGLIAVVAVTTVVSGVVVASAVVSSEVTDGDACELDQGSDSLSTLTPTDVATYVGTVTECLSGSDTPHRSADDSPRTVPIGE